VAGPAYGYPFYRPIWAPAYVSFFGFGGFDLAAGWNRLAAARARRLFPSLGGRWGGYRFGRLGENRGGFAPLRAGSRFSNVNLAMHNANFRGATSVSGHDFGTGHGTVRAVSHSEMQNAHFANGSWE